MCKKIYLSGSNENINNNPFFFTEFPNGELIYPKDEIFRTIDNLLVDLHFTFEKRYFGENFYEKKASFSIWFDEAGISSESMLSKLDFEKFLNDDKSENTNKALMVADIRNIITSCQERILETKSLFETFYKELNKLKGHLDTTIFFLSGNNATYILSFLENFFVKLYSVLDLLSKILVEYKTTYTDFSHYSKLKSKDTLFGDIKYSSSLRNTIYDKDCNINLLLNLRNEIIHNGSFTYQNYIYFSYDEKHVLKEKYILLMDNDNGIIDTIKNRKRFYSKDIKLNYLLPDFYFSILEKIKNTIILFLS